MADQYARGFRSALSAAKRELHDMADELDRRTEDEAFAGKSPIEAVRRLRQGAQRVGALKPHSRAASGALIAEASEL